MPIGWICTLSEPAVFLDQRSGVAFQFSSTNESGAVLGTKWIQFNSAQLWGALDEAMAQLNEQPRKTVLMTGLQLALRKLDESHNTPKAKCPFTPQRERVLNLWGQNLP
jgi:hypothetical protein